MVQEWLDTYSWMAVCLNAYLNVLEGKKKRTVYGYENINKLLISAQM